MNAVLDIGPMVILRASDLIPCPAYPRTYSWFVSVPRLGNQRQLAPEESTSRGLGLLQTGLLLMLLYRLKNSETLHGVLVVVAALKIDCSLWYWRDKIARCKVYTFMAFIWRPADTIILG